MPNSNGNGLSISRRKPDVFDQVSQRARPRDVFDQVAGNSSNDKNIFHQLAAANTPNQPQPFVPLDTTAQARAYALRPLTEATQPTERAMQFGPGGMQFVDVPAGTKASFEKANLAGYQKGARIGAENVGALAIGEAAPAVIGRLLPSAARAGAKFEQIKAAIGNLPIEGHLDRAAKLAWRAKELDEAGGNAPGVIEKFLSRLYNPAKGPLTYSEVRDFYSNAARLSVEEIKSMKGPMGATVKQFAAALDDGIRKGATLAGQGKKYAEAVSEYRRAASLGRFGERVSTAGKQFLRGLPYGGGATVGGGIMYELYRALRGR